MYLELARETSTRKLYTDELQWSAIFQAKSNIYFIL